MMCTVSWLRRTDGYDLLCNRDEQSTRPRALMPRVCATGGVRYVAPIDPVAGGTWIGVNEYGLTACILNAHPQRALSEQPLASRGLLVIDLLGRRSLFDAARDAVTRNLTQFAPFSLLFVQPNARALIVAWDGRHSLVLPDADQLCPLASSSLDERTAVRQRRRVWRQEQRTTVGALEAYHHSHEGGPGPWSVCMHRGDAETVSFTHISVCAGRAQLQYRPEAPCRADFVVTTTLALLNPDEHRTPRARIRDLGR